MKGGGGGVMIYTFSIANTTFCKLYYIQHMLQLCNGPDVVDEIVSKSIVSKNITFA